MDSNCTPFSVDDLSDDHELDLIQLQHGEVQEAVIQTTKRGKPISSIWNLFTDAIDAHQVSSGNNCICKHCKQSVRHHNKTISVQTHLKKCKPFMLLMKDTAVADRPEWWSNKKLTSALNSISHKVPARDSTQTLITNYAAPKLTKEQLAILHETIAMHYFCTGTSFQRIEEQHLLKAFQVVNPSVTLPSRQKLAGSLLESCYKKVKIEVDKILSCKTQNLCITSDGWSNISNEAVVNYMAVSPNQTIFVESVNTAEQSHNADWIASDLQRFIDSVDCNVVGAVTDNTSTNKKAWRYLKEQNPTRFFHGCVSHGLHLMVKDIFAATKKKSVGSAEPVYPDSGYPFEHLLHFATSCKEIVIHFHNHHAMKAMLKAALKAANLPRLVAPAPTRWGTLIGCFRSILAADSVLNAIVSQRDFEGNGTTKQKQQKRFIKEIITSVDFLDYLKISIKILEPIDMFITMFQSDSVPISEVYQAFIKLPNIFSEIVGISLEQKDFLIKLTAERLNFIYGDAHGFGNILDPRYLGDGMDRELRSQVEDLLFAFGPDESTERKEKIYDEYTKFRVSVLQERTADSFRFKMLKKGTKTVMQYWVSDGNDWPVLQQVALRVFSMACSTAASERNFSTFGFIHTKLRNSLTEDNVRKLVYIKTNALQLSDQPPQIDDDNSGQEEEDDIVI
ncbi:hypothetical protein BASA50_002268 [Batrachochytrium salamandrivorans]|uniref:BED-type domain-containing protein n=1 Tax=Batrachochytrium salamandrivorans TaxID=1357716 RepID=A0ABQ8FPP4_9FUNG|nr:hypothetical protein BASA50_002268 [Batrachochytrium salamandrivorans]